MSNKTNGKNNFVKLIKNKLGSKIGGNRKKKGADFGMPGYYQTFYNAPGKPVWSGRNYNKFSDEGFKKNVITHRAISIIASGAASVPWVVSDDNAEYGVNTLANNILPQKGRVGGGKYSQSERDGAQAKLKKLKELLGYPNPSMGGAEFFEAVYSYKLISGNAYIQAVRSSDGMAQELFALRPDRMAVIAGKSSVAAGYRYSVGEKYKDFKVDRLTGQSDILHLKNFHPLDDWYGLSDIEAAAYSIDQHNQAGEWNQALLQNGARPSGALIVKGAGKNEAGYLSEDQYTRIKAQIEEAHSGSANAGRPLLLEGGLEWKEMSLSPKDMDFLNVKNSAARDIALAFGVPAQLLGIPGDNTYNNMAEARLALWEQTIIPLLENTASALNNWLVPMFGDNFTITYDKNAISALMARRESLWDSLKDVDFLSDEEKREMVGF